jgi:hypothetical protein
MYLYIELADAHENACFGEIEMGKSSVIQAWRVDRHKIRGIYVVAVICNIVSGVTNSDLKALSLQYLETHRFIHVRLPPPRKHQKVVCENKENSHLFP